jgi:hypothetical protein
MAYEAMFATEVLEAMVLRWERPEVKMVPFGIF